MSKVRQTHQENIGHHCISVWLISDDTYRDAQQELLYGQGIIKESASTDLGRSSYSQVVRYPLIFSVCRPTETLDRNFGLKAHHQSWRRTWWSAGGLESLGLFHRSFTRSWPKLCRARSTPRCHSGLPGCCKCSTERVCCNTPCNASTPKVSQS